jgi:TRAP-type mannitol/chloroaromatic compound transport system permease small subunit
MAHRAVGKSIIWLVLVVTLIAPAMRSCATTINYSSNAFLEIQWYLFSAIFLFGAGYTLMRNEHVRIDLIAGRLSKRRRRGSTSSASFSSCCRWRLP